MVQVKSRGFEVGGTWVECQLYYLAAGTHTHCHDSWKEAREEDRGLTAKKT